MLLHPHRTSRDTNPMLAARFERHTAISDFALLILWSRLLVCKIPKVTFIAQRGRKNFEATSLFGRISTEFLREVLLHQHSIERRGCLFHSLSGEVFRGTYSRMILTKTPSGRVWLPRMWMTPS